MEQDGRIPLNADDFLKAPMGVADARGRAPIQTMRGQKNPHDSVVGGISTV